ncbi:MAG TPA: DPP IV N-terminal domain-containing protein, partial [Candidatus Cybelea sp.]
MLPPPPVSITLDTVYAKEPLSGRMIDRVSWSPDGARFLYVRRSQDPNENLALLLYDMATGTTRVWLRSETFAATPEVAGWSPDAKHVALLAGGDLYTADTVRPHPRKIAADVDAAQWSPQADVLAYSHDADLYLAAVGKHVAIRQITRGGVPNDLLNGSLDWVYPEELGIEHGFRWSPDGKRIAYLTMNERRVTNFPIVDFLTTDNKVERERYPLAGEANPRVTLRVVTLSTGANHLVYDAARRDEYLANFDWLPHSDSLEAEILDRAQRAMRVELWRHAAGSPSELYRQTSPSWVDVVPLPFWRSSGRSVWLLDRAHTAGVYVRERDGSFRKLSGAYRVTDLFGVADGTVYISAAYPTRRDRSFLALSLSGAQRNFTAEPGWHESVPAPTFTGFVDTYSRLNDPPQVNLVALPSGAAKNLAPENLSLKAALSPAKMLDIPSAYGALDAFEIDPPGFERSKKWPVVMYVYGGPDA